MWPKMIYLCAYPSFAVFFFKTAQETYTSDPQGLTARRKAGESFSQTQLPSGLTLLRGFLGGSARAMVGEVELVEEAVVAFSTDCPL